MKVQGCGMGNRGIVVRFLRGEANFSVLLSTRTSSWAQLAFYSMGAGALSTGVKWSGSKPDQSLRCSAEVKNEWRFTPTPPIYLNGRHRGTLLFHSAFYLPTIVHYTVFLNSHISSCFYAFPFLLIPSSGSCTPN